MEFDRFHQFGSLLLHDDFVFSYSGYVTEDILEAVGATLRQRLADHIDNLKQIRNVFSTFVELMQNVIRYGTNGPQPVGKCGDRETFGLVMVACNAAFNGASSLSAAATAVILPPASQQHATPIRTHKRNQRR